MRASAKLTLALAAFAVVGAAAAQQPAAPARPTPFLGAGEQVDTLKLIPPPPAAGSPDEAADLAAFRETRKLADSPRWTQATADVELFSPAAFTSWSCAAGVRISAETTPATARLMQRALFDAGAAANPPKEHYKRPRPFTGVTARTCVAPASLGANASYPSGHASVGWAWALILAELKPERANELLLRGREFGDSRVVCGVHYPSDVEAGRVIGAAVVARLHADAEFEAAMAEAKAELAKASAKPEGCGA
ncbi:phosphatase PAP2 family protein [Phenylobacterium sp.]|jgi:acid phosphatase (class A)|uniref:acid phosphatase n=1 Tax=Phenylobacterium sp. TaxID=1871053 RepID=UPI002E354070|nr:phosphatase PAP2 family protein [Phenylobacterium sp.]HEX2559009.1 phosphatase PAP2 family protein [Phenylobacterium sp.]